MTTFTYRDIIQEMLDNDGVYPGDPQAWGIFEYRNIYGKIVWAVFSRESDFNLHASPHITDWTPLWLQVPFLVWPAGTIAEIGVLSNEE